MLFSLDADEDGDGWCNMVLGGAEQASSEEGEMDQDDGKTALDERRKFRTPGSDDSVGWEEVDVLPPFPGVGHTTLTGALASEMDLPKTGKKEEKTKQDVVVPVPKDKIENIRVTSFLDVRPRAIQQLRVRELQADLERWGAAVSGTKAELLVRLGRLYSGDPVLKKGCTTRYVQLEEVRGHSRGYHSGTAGPTSPSSAAPQASTKPPEAAEARPTTTPTISATGNRYIFRSSGPSNVVKTEPVVDPRTGLKVPAGLEVGGEIPEVRCMVCGSHMVLRRRRDGTAFFAGCGNFATARGCKFAYNMDELLELWPGPRPEQQ